MQMFNQNTIVNSKPTIVGLLLHFVIFFIIVLIFLFVNKENYTFSGLANPANMLECNNAMLFAQNNDCNDCADVATKALGNPFGVNTKDIIKKCSKSCKIKPIVDLVAQACGNIQPPQNFLPKPDKCCNQIIHDPAQKNATPYNDCQKRCSQLNCCNEQCLNNCNVMFN